MHMCHKCKMLTAAVFLILGVLFLLRDLGVWWFWNIQPWTALFIVVPLIGVCKSKCPMCQKECCSEKTKKR